MVPSDGLPGGAAARADLLATEEPLGIRVDGSALTVTMLTPGDDVELAAGFLAGEAVVRSPHDIAHYVKHRQKEDPCREKPGAGRPRSRE